MSKFGELISGNTPVLLDFYTEQNEKSIEINQLIHKVASALGDKAKVIKINADKNQELVDALKIKSIPTFIIYKYGEMVWRQSGNVDAIDLILKVEEIL
ncbi:MAG: thioredoxin family protein [Flavobacterium sp.]|jgi:thioredoxin 1